MPLVEWGLLLLALPLVVVLGAGAAFVGWARWQGLAWRTIWRILRGKG